MQIKPINFRPNQEDQDVIDVLMDNFDFKNRSEMIRQALFMFGVSSLGEEKFLESLKRKRGHRLDREIMNEIIKQSRDK